MPVRVRSGPRPYPRPSGSRRCPPKADVACSTHAEGATRGSLIGGAPLSRSGLRQVRLLHRAQHHLPIVQLDRTRGYGPRDWGFKSLWAGYNASVAKLEYARDLGSRGATHGGSTPPARTAQLESSLRRVRVIASGRSSPVLGNAVGPVSSKSSVSTHATCSRQKVT